jgi:hypothetical protein
MSTNQKVTIYTVGGFGLSAIRATLINHGRKQYAQYPDAPFVHFTEKGKRKPTGFVIGSYQPYLLIVAGHDAPAAPDPLIPDESSPGFTVTKSRYSTFDPRWEFDANKILNEWITLYPDRVIADYRHSNATAETASTATA